VSRYHLNSLFSALCDWLTPADAITDNPVPVYSLAKGSLLEAKFLRQIHQTTSALLPGGDFHRTSPSLSRYFALTTPE